MPKGLLKPTRRNGFSVRLLDPGHCNLTNEGSETMRQIILPSLHQIVSWVTWAKP